MENTFTVFVMCVPVVLSLCLTVVLLVLVSVYWRVVRPAKFIYDSLRSQGVGNEPFIPVIGQLFKLRRIREEGRVLEYHQDLTKKYGLRYLFSLGPYPRLVIQEPDLISDILGRTNGHNYYKPADFSFRLKPLIGIRNLLVSNGEEHNRARKMLNPAFHSDNLQSMISIMTEHTTQTIDVLLQSPAAVNLATHFSRLALSIIVSSAFGRNSAADSNSRDAIARTFTEILAALSYRLARMIMLIPIVSQLPFWGKDTIDRGADELDKFIQQIINDRRQGRSQSQCANEDLLDLLLSAVDSDGQGFSNEEIRDQALTFVLAGHETTGNLMAWVMYELMTNPSIYQACQKEVDRVLPNGLIPTVEHLQELSIIEAVLREALRLYPPAPFFARQCIQEHTIGKSTDQPLHIPLGTTILVNSYAVHRRAEYWPRPTEFDYTRWLRDPITDLKPKLAHPYCYLPFAAGARNCIGQNFALLEAKIMLAMLLQRCHFTLEPGQLIVPQIRITMSPKYGLFARVSPR